MTAARAAPSYRRAGMATKPAMSAPAIAPSVFHAYTRALAGAALALLYVVCTYSVTVRDSRWMVLLVAGVGLQATLIALFHESPAQVATMQAIACSAVLLANEAVFHSLLMERRR